MAEFLSTRPHLFLYAGQDVVDHQTWYGAAEARGVADAYAAVMTLTVGDEDEHIPLWNIVTKQKVTGIGESVACFVCR